jgi:hypothetical protein
MLLPYIVPPIWIKGEWRKYKGRIAMGVAAAVIIFIAGFINPQGIRAMAYLINSSNLVDTGDVIGEMHSATLRSVIGIAVIVEAIMFGIAMYAKKLNSELIWLIVGTMVLAVSVARNCYMITYGIVPLCILVLKDNDNVLSNGKFSKIEYEIIRVLYIAAVIIMLIISVRGFILCANTENDDKLDYMLYPQVEYLESNTQDLKKEDLSIYAPFHCGQYFQFYGYKTYMDARPELYMSTINGTEDIWNEWYDVIYSGSADDTQLQEFLDKYNFDYLCTQRAGNLGAYLRVLDDYEEVVYGTEYSLFKNLSK